jgi:hypothetical protein
MQFGLADVASSILRSIPDLVVWVLGIVLSAIMVRRGGGKPEKMLLIGCCLMSVEQLFSPFVNYLFSVNMAMENMSRLDTARTYGIIRTIYSAVLDIPAIVLLVWAFWIKFRKKKEVTA